MPETACGSSSTVSIASSKVLLRLGLDFSKVRFGSLCKVGRQLILYVACFFWQEMSNTGYLIVRPVITRPPGSVQVQSSPAGPKP